MCAQMCVVLDKAEHESAQLNSVDGALTWQDTCARIAEQRVRPELVASSRATLTNLVADSRRTVAAKCARLKCALVHRVNEDVASLLSPAFLASPTAARVRLALCLVLLAARFSCSRFTCASLFCACRWTRC